MKPANDDPDARVDAINRRVLELQAYMSQPGRTEEEGGRVVAEMLRLVAELDEIGRERREHIASLRKQLQAAGFPTLRRVITDTNGKTVIF